MSIPNPATTNLVHDVLGAGRGSLDAIFAPRSVAVIGATEKAGSVGRTILRNPVGNPFGGTVFPVNPNRPNVLGIKAYRSIGAVPDRVEVTPSPLGPNNSKTPRFRRMIEVLDLPRSSATRRFSVNASLHRRLNRRKRRILRRLENQPDVERPVPRLTAANIDYELTERTRALAPGGIGAIHLLARRVGLIHDIDEGLHLRQQHLPARAGRG